MAKAVDEFRARAFLHDAVPDETLILWAHQDGRERDGAGAVRIAWGRHGGDRGREGGEATPPNQASPDGAPVAPEAESPPAGESGGCPHNRTVTEPSGDAACIDCGEVLIAAEPRCAHAWGLDAWPGAGQPIRIVERCSTCGDWGSCPDGEHPARCDSGWPDGAGDDERLVYCTRCGEILQGELPSVTHNTDEMIAWLREREIDPEQYQATDVGLRDIEIRHPLFMDVDEVEVIENRRVVYRYCGGLDEGEDAVQAPISERIDDDEVLF